MKKHLPIIFVISAFLPYLSKTHGLRVENVFGTAMFAICLFPFLKQTHNKRLFIVLGYMSALAIWVCAVTLLNLQDIENIKNGFGRLDHYLRPVIILLPLSVMLRNISLEDRRSIFAKTCIALLLMLTINTLVQILSMCVDMHQYISIFRPAIGESGYTVAENAARNARFVGLFNQPLEQGVSYSAGLLCWVYLYKKRIITVKYLWLFFVAIIVGGTLAISKVFLIGGVMLFFLLIIWSKILTRPRGTIFILSFVIISFFLFEWLSDFWMGMDSVIKLYAVNDSSVGLISKLTAGRFGSETSYLTEKAIDSLNASFFTGIGLASGILGDNAYLMVLSESGVFGLLLFISGLLLIVFFSIPYLHKTNDAKLLFMLGILTIGSSMGGPITGIPRCGTIIWVFIGQLLLLLNHKRLSSNRLACV